MSWYNIVKSSVILTQVLNSFKTSCPTNTKLIRLGNPGDGGWFICESKDLYKKGCTMFSFGIANDDSFDRAFALKYPKCSVLMFDPTPFVVSHYNKINVSKKINNLAFYPWGLSSKNTVTKMNNIYTSNKEISNLIMKNITTIKKKLNIPNRINLIKIDVEGFEWEEMQTNSSEIMSKKLKKTENKLLNISPDMFDSNQVAIEIHGGSYDSWVKTFEKFKLHGFELVHVHGARFHSKTIPMAELLFFRTKI